MNRARLFLAVCCALIAATWAILVMRQDSDSPLVLVECTNKSVVYYKNRDFVVAINKEVTKNQLGKDTIFVDFIRIRDTSAEFTHVMKDVDRILLEQKFFGSEKAWEIQSWASHGANYGSNRYAVAAIEKK